MELLVRNKVEDYARWKRVFDAQEPAGRAAGLTVARLWRAADDPQQVFFLLEIDDRARAEAFMNAPESAAAGRRAGVIDGEVFFLEPAD